MGNAIQRFKGTAGLAVRKLTIWLSGEEAGIASSPVLLSGSGVPSATVPNGSMYYRTNGSAYLRTGDAWVITEQTPGDYGTGPLLVDVIDESTAAAGVTVDGVLLKDGGAVFADGAAVEVDTVNEATAAAGVTIDGLLIKDGSVRPDVIADPGDAGAIPVDESGTCAITTAGAETRTLAIPTFAGQEIAISMDVDGPGDAVITVAQAINQAGNTIITLNDAGDFILLKGVTIGGALRWRVAANDGATLS